MGFYALGRLEFASECPDQEEPVRQHLIQARIALTYERQLKNLSLQEGRLRRQREKDMVALRELQEKRNEERTDRLNTAAHNYIVAVIEETNDEFDLGQFGFEFTLAEIEVRAMEIDEAAFLSEPKIPKIDPKLFDVWERELARKRAAKLQKAA